MEHFSKGSQTRSRVISAAVDLINTKGFASTSMNDIIEATGVKKGNLYFHFSSKEELGAELIRQAKDEYLCYLSESMTGESPGANIVRLLEAVFQWHKKRKFVGGCLFGNIALEMADVHPEFSTLVRGVFEEWIRVLARLIRKAGASGEIRGDLDPDKTARHIVASMEGAIMMARLSKNGKDIRDCMSSLYRMIGFKSKIPSGEEA